MADSRHNKYVSVTDWFKPAPGSTASGTVSGSTGAATSGASFVGGSWGSGGSGGGQTITIIKTNDTTPESNSNVYSALRVHNNFIAKDKDERTEGKLSSDAGFEVGEFVSGVSGAICYVDPETLQTTAELDRLKVRVKAYFETLEIVNVNSVGGKQIISPAGSINCIRVDEHGGTIDIQKERQATDEEGNPLYDINGNPIMETYIESVDNGVPEDTYRCYFLAEQDGETIENRFHVGDQAYSQMFDAQPGISSNVSSKYYWRLVTGISYDPIEIAGKKYHYIDLSVSDCDTDSDAPSVGDIICHRGHRTLPGDIEGRDRQNALEFSAVDTFSPSITLYQGIGESDPDNGKYPYSLVGKDIIQYGVNRLNNRAFMNVYGDMYVGDRDGQSYLQFDETAGLTVKGNIQFGSKSKMEGDDLTLEERIELASKAYEEDVNQFKAAVEKSFSDVQNQIDGAIETYFLDPEPTLENEPAIDWNTDQIKAAHVGDLYYSKQGNAYRFQYDEITDDDGSKHNLYYWNLIKDTDITLALANAQKAQDTADSKRKIFVKQPSTNDSYEEGDMWANATYPATGTPKYSNDLLRAITAKQPGEAFSIDHWVLSSKYTDDTAAIAAQEAADEAQRAANNAQSDATAAANRLSSWAADNVISPTEKQGIKEEYVRVIKDKDSIHEQWDYYFLDTTGSTEIGKIYIAYNNAYLPYVEQLIYLFTAKDSDGVALENIPIPDDFDDNQTAYYSNRTIALNTIAAAAKKVADDAQAAADNAYEEAEKALTAAEEAKTSVYGLNTTVTGLKDFTDDAFLDGIINSSERKTIENYIYQINTVLAQVQQSYSEVVDNTFLVESVAKTNLENSYNSFITATNELLQTVNVISNQGSVENIDRAGFEVKYNNFNSKYSDYTKYLNAAIKFIEYAINSRVDTTLQELGGYSYLKNAFNEETTVTGGLVLTSLVALGYTDDNQQYHVMGGINGSHANNDGIAIWAGGSAVDRAIEPNNPNAADFLVRMDGTGYAAGGNFWWESNGTIHADPLSFVISDNSVGALLASFDVKYDVIDGLIKPAFLIPTVPFTKLTIASDIELNSNARISFGDVYLAYDNVNNSVYIANQNGSPVNFYISGGISMYSAGSMASTSIMDIIAQNIDTNTLKINDQGLLTVIGGGTGGGGSIDYPLSWSGFSSGSFDGSAAKTIYIPSKLSELTNDASYAKTSDLSGYLPLSGGTLTASTTAATLWIQSGQTNDSAIGFKRKGQSDWAYITYRGDENWCVSNEGWTKNLTLYHSGNFNPSDYLPLTGGELSNALGIKKTSSDSLPLLTIEKGGAYDSRITLKNTVDALSLVAHKSGDAYITLNGAHSLVFETNNTERMRISDKGDINISGTYGALTISTGTDKKFILDNTDNDSKYQYISFRQNGTEYGTLGTSFDDNLLWNQNYILHSKNYSSYALPLTGGTLTGSLTTKDFWSGMDSAGTYIEGLTTLGIRLQYKRADEKYDDLYLNNGTVTFNKNIILHSSNYSSYALPLTGGELSGALKFGTDSTVSNSIASDTRLPSHIFRNVYSNDGNVYDHYFNNKYTASSNTFANLRVKSENGYYRTFRFGGDGTFAWDGNTIIHSGNIGSQSVNYAATAKGLVRLAATTDDYSTYLKTYEYLGLSILTNTSGASIGNIGATYTVLNIGGNDMNRFGRFMFTRADDSSELYWQTANNAITAWGTKRKIAFTDSNVASATNADKLDGLHLYSPGSGTGGVTYIGGDGVMEVSSIIDFRSNNSDGNDFNTRLYSTGSYKNQVQLPTSSGTLALTTDNVASATKLQTARTIWGQSFNGEGDISGSLSGVWNLYVSSEITLYQSGTQYLTSIITSGNAFKIQPRIEGTGYNVNTLINPSGGNVGIGITNPSSKLDVNGAIRANGNILLESANGITGGGIAFWDGSSYVHGTINASRLILNGNSSAGNVGIGNIAPAYKLDVTGTFNASSNASVGGTLSVTGATTLSGGLTVSGNANMSNVCGTNGLNICPFGSSVAGSRVFFTTNAVRPFGDDKDLISLGTSSIRWKDVYSNFNDTIAMKTNTIRFECDANGSASGRDGEINRYNGNLHLQYNTTGATTICVGGGNVGIGTESPSTKLQVNGVIFGYAYSAIGNNNAAFVFDKNGSHATGIGSCNTADTIFFGACNTSGVWVTYTQTWKFGGNIITNGGITMYSDQRKKTILNHVELSLKDIANAPLIEHYYNSDNKKTTHVGSIAQYWASMNDWFCKLDSEGYYTMEIQNCALASAISIARELDRYESETDRRIANLERENALLKEEIRNLKSA